MKATGIVRRIDPLGRVVIPKEIRRTMGIREKEPLEIYTGDDGEVIFKKYSPIATLSTHSGQLTEVLYDTSGYAAAVCDRDKIIAVSGFPQKVLLERRVSHAMAAHMEQRLSFPVEGGTATLLPIEGMNYEMVAGAPIIAMGDWFGYVMLISTQAEIATEVACKLVYATASFLAKKIDC